MIVGCTVFNSAKYNYTAKRDDYLTPDKFLYELMEKEDIIIFDCDVCCSVFNIPAIWHFKKDGLYNLDGQKKSNENGLTGDWYQLNWCNPPFKTAGLWVEKAYREMKNGNTTYMLVPARPETKYWHDFILDEDGGTNRKNIKVKFLRKGLRFINPDTKNSMGVYKNALALVIFEGSKNA